ncbi:MAG TPA: hypothetical protein VGE98_09180, partial [Thermoanaerobaculia bacterium]
VQATFVPEGKSALSMPSTTLQAEVGPSTSRVNPRLDLSSIANAGGMVLLSPTLGLQLVEVSFEVEQNPIRTAWKLPLLTANDFFRANSTAYVLNLVKTPTAASGLQIFNIGSQPAKCNVTVLRPKGSPIEQRSGVTVPAIGVIRLADILKNVTAGQAGNITAAVSCDQAFYALGNLPATDRWQSRVEYPVAAPIPPLAAVTLDSRPGEFLRVTKSNSDLKIPVPLDPNVNYHTLSIDFDVTVADPPDFVVFRNVIGMFRFGGRRFGKTLYFGSFENFDKSKFVVDLGSPFIETTLKRNFPLQGGHKYHFSITLDNDQQSLHYVITNPNGGVIMDMLGGLYNDFNVVGGNAPIIQIGLNGIADNAYYPPYGWHFANFKLVATK